MAHKQITWRFSNYGKICVQLCPVEPLIEKIKSQSTHWLQTHVQILLHDNGHPLLQMWNLIQFVVHWDLSLTAPVLIMAQKRKVAHLVFGSFVLCGVICTEAIKVRPQWTTNGLRFHKLAQTVQSLLDIRRGLTDRHTNRQTDANKCIISLFRSR